jgi:hypothetical protein
VHKFDAEIVNNEREADVSGGVLPESSCSGGWEVSVCGEVFLEALIGEDAGVF